MQTESRPSRRFLLNVNIVFLAQIAIYGLAFGLRIALARGLGDEGLGTYSLFFLVVIVAGAIANLGVGLGNIYFLNKGTYPYGTLLSTSLFLLIVTSLLVWALLFGYAMIFGAGLFVSGRTYWLYMAAFPIVVGYTLITSFLHGSSRFLALSIVSITQGFSGLIIVGGFYAADRLDVFGALFAWTVSFLVADILALLFIGRKNIRIGEILRPPLHVLKEQVRYGAQGQVANLAQLFNYRLDQFLVAALVSTAGVGHYVAAVGLSESVWWISSAVAMVMLPHLTEMDPRLADEMTPLVTRNTLFVSILGSVVIMAASPLLIRLLFGADFTPAQTPLLLLMPGIIAGSATRVLGSYLFSQGRVIYTTYATLIALVGTIILDLAFIPWLEVSGAAIASSCAYIMSLVAILYWYRSVSGRHISDALIVKPDDIQFYLGLWRKFRGRRTAAEKEVA